VASPASPTRSPSSSGCGRRPNTAAAATPGAC
jgi:hypothetical protein